MILLILDDVNRKLVEFFKAKDIYHRLIVILEDIEDVSFDSSDASSKINDTISSTKSWSVSDNSPTDTIAMCRSTATRIIGALRIDNGYCERRHQACKEKNGWQTVGAVGMGIVSAIALFTVPILSAAAAGAAAGIGDDAKKTVENSKNHLSAVLSRNNRFIELLQSFSSSL